MTRIAGVGGDGELGHLRRRLVAYDLLPHPADVHGERVLAHDVV